jgi:hypothetical protein
VFGIGEETGDVWRLQPEILVIIEACTTLDRALPAQRRIVSNGITALKPHVDRYSTVSTFH